jgi:outer membrane receptor for Fe3+-dicitrate
LENDDGVKFSVTPLEKAGFLTGILKPQVIDNDHWIENKGFPGLVHLYKIHDGIVLPEEYKTNFFSFMIEVIGYVITSTYIYCSIAL